MGNKYQREIKPGVFVDVYDVLKAFSVVNPALQHLVKKALAVGQRGHKDAAEDLQDIIDSAIRAKELGVREVREVREAPVAECKHDWLRNPPDGINSYYCPKCGLTGKG